MTTETCAHDRPTFGCGGCVNADKRRIIDLAVGTTEAPKCFDCGSRTVFNGKDYSLMELYFRCRSCGSEQTVEVKR